MMKMNKEDLIKISDEIGELTIITTKARTIMSDLVQDLAVDGSDVPEETLDRLKYEAHRILVFMQIAFDYVIQADNMVTKVDSFLNKSE